MSESRPTFVFNGINFHSPNNGGWHLPAGSENSVAVPFDFMAGRLVDTLLGLQTSGSGILCPYQICLDFGQELSVKEQWTKIFIVRLGTVVHG